MADSSVPITAGAGTSVDTRTEATNGNHRQVMVIGDPSVNAGVAPVDATNGLSVNITNGSIAVTGAFTEYTEDSVADSDPTGIINMLVRADTPGAIASTNGDNLAQRGTNYGAGFVQVVNSSGAFVDTFGGGTQYTEGDTDATITGTATMMEVAANTLQPIQGTVADGLLVNLGANNDVTVTGTVTANLAAGTNNIGDVDVLTINGVAPAFGSGVRGATVQRVTIATDDSVPVTIASVPSHAVTNIGTFAVQESGAALTALQLIDNAVSGSGFNVSQINGVTPLMGSGATGTGSPRVTAATDSPEVTSLAIMDDWDNGASDGASVSGDVAHGTADAGEPVKVGGKALSADPTAEATGDRVNALFDLIGRQVVFPYSLKENLVSGAITTAMTGTTSTSLVAAPGAGLFNYITQITVSNAHATVGTDIAIQDGSGGTTIYTIPAAAVYGGAVVTFPAPLKQPTSNTALFCANVTTGASTKVSASGFKGT